MAVGSGLILASDSFIRFKGGIMRHGYYNYSKEELLKNPKIELISMEDGEKVFQSMAEEMVAEIEKNNEMGENTVFICPVGPVGQYKYFVEAVNKGRISLKNVWFINMDEYLTDEKEWISKDDPLSFRGFMYSEVYDKIDKDLVMPESQRVFPDPKRLGRIPELINELGGVDICFGGIGINGHVAFNEPEGNLSEEEFRSLQTRVLEIKPETRAINAVGALNGAIEDMPRYCITIGFKEISEAKKIRLGCFRDWHRAVVRRAAYGEMTTEFPVSLLQSHKDINIKFPRLVAEIK